MYVKKKYVHLKEWVENDIVTSSNTDTSLSDGEGRREKEFFICILFKNSTKQDIHHVDWVITGKSQTEWYIILRYLLFTIFYWSTHQNILHFDISMDHLCCMQIL